MTRPKVTSIVLAYNGIDLTMKCLESLLKQDYSNHQVILVDNASQDDTVSTVQSSFLEINIIESQVNLGYAAGNNLGMRNALQNGSDYLFLVNNDTVLMPNCVSQLVEILESNNMAGIVGPMVHTFDPDQIISSAGGKIDWDLANSINIGAGKPDHGQYPQREVDFVNGCGIMIRSETAANVGLIDENYFMYWEEVDWCTRVRKSGWLVIFSPLALMQHKAPITSETLSPTTLYYLARNRLRFFGLHTPWPNKPSTIAHAIHGIIRSIQSSKNNGKTAHVKAAQTALLHAVVGKWGFTAPSW